MPLFVNKTRYLHHLQCLKLILLMDFNPAVINNDQNGLFSVFVLQLYLCWQFFMFTEYVLLRWKKLLVKNVQW